jgi:hypothetical protein
VCRRSIGGGKLGSSSGFVKPKERAEP